MRTLAQLCVRRVSPCCAALIALSVQTRSLFRHGLDVRAWLLYACSSDTSCPASRPLRDLTTRSPSATESWPRLEVFGSSRELSFICDDDCVRQHGSAW